MNDKDWFLKEQHDPTSSFYHSYFRKHLAHVHAHLAGNDGQPLAPSRTSTTGYWTPSEKDAFFHGLCVYSRFRPDLIAASIGTKTVVDVCTYLEAIEDSCSRNRTPAARNLRTNLECAMEVSEPWVEWENEAAATLIEHDAVLWEEYKDSTKNFSEMGEASQKSEQARQRGHKYALKRLDECYLRVMEGILREGDLGIMESAGQSEQSSTRVASLPRSTANEEPTDPTLHPSPSISLTIHSLPGSTPTQEEHLQDPHRANEKSQAVSPSCLDLSFAVRPSIPLFAPHAELSPEPGDRQPDAALSPSTRRRLQKRLYMRRKRAETKGEPLNIVNEKLRPGRKSKERKTKARPKTYSSKRIGFQNTYPEDQQVEAAADKDVNSDVDGNVSVICPPALSSESTPNADQARVIEEQDQQTPDDIEMSNYAHHNKGGITKPYKVRKIFEEQGIDYNTLVENDLGLFHLSAVNRLMRLFKAGYDSSTTATITSISADTIRLLTAILLEFTTEAVHRAIISREQEKKIKGQIKVWRIHNHDDITAENVGHAMELMGMKGVSKKQYFEDFLEDYTQLSDQASEDNDSEDENGIQAENELFSAEENKTSFAAAVSLYRELHPPLTYLPRDMILSSTSPDDDGASLMPIDTDEDLLVSELEEELKLDERDQLFESEYENGLWEELISLGVVERA